MNSTYDIEEYDHRAGNSVDYVAEATHPERPRWYICPSGEYMREDGQEVRDRREYDERADQVCERRLAAKLNRAKCSGEEGAKDCGFNGARQFRVDPAEETCKGRGIVSSQGPPQSSDHQDRANRADHDREEDDEEQAERSACTASGLRVYFCQRKASVAPGDCAQIVYPVEDGDAVDEGSQEAEAHLSKHSFGKIDLLRESDR